MENVRSKRLAPAIRADAVKPTEAEFRNFLALIAAHKLIRELAPELVGRTVAELSSLRALRHILVELCRLK